MQHSNYPPSLTIHPFICHSAKMQKTKSRVMVYCHDTYGLGNIRRMLSICEDLVSNDPELSILFISGSPLIYGFTIPPRVEHIKLPELTRTKNNGYSSKSLPANLDQIIKLRAELIYIAAKNFQPDVFLIDKKPLGVENELELSLNYLNREHSKTKLVLLLRDILDSPKITERIWNRNGYHDIIDRYFDSVLVVGSSKVFDLGKEYNFPPSTLKKLHYCGYIKRLPSESGHDKPHPGKKKDDKKHILVTVGGGEDGYRVLDNYVRAISLLPERHNTESIIVTGPELCEERMRKLTEATKAYPFVRMIRFTDNMVHYMDQADLIISMCGYNTSCEILSLKKRAIVIPRVSPVKEQWIRAERLARLGLCKTIHPANLTPERLLNAVLEEIWLEIDPMATRYSISLEGLKNVRRRIYNQRSEADLMNALHSYAV